MILKYIHLINKIRTIIIKSLTKLKLIQQRNKLIKKVLNNILQIYNIDYMNKKLINNLNLKIIIIINYYKIYIIKVL